MKPGTGNMVVDEMFPGKITITITITINKQVNPNPLHDRPRIDQEWTDR